MSHHTSQSSQSHDAEPHTTATIEFGGEELTLLPERVVWWKSQDTLFVADLHFGKDATFREAGVPIPSTLQSDLSRLSAVIRQTAASRLIALGDLIHSRYGRTIDIELEFARWRAQSPEVEFTLVRGNHDWCAGDPPDSWQIKCENPPASCGPMNLVHHPTFREDTPTLAGHLHPKIRLRQGADELRLPCFLRRNSTLVLPAFSSFVDHDMFAPANGDSVYAVVDSHVVAV